MKTDFKDIRIGQFIAKRVQECDMDNVRICNFFRCSQEEVEEMYKKQDLCTELLLKWSKLLSYDFSGYILSILYCIRHRKEVRKKMNQYLLHYPCSESIFIQKSLFLL